MTASLRWQYTETSEETGLAVNRKGSGTSDARRSLWFIGVQFAVQYIGCQRISVAFLNNSGVTVPPPQTPQCGNRSVKGPFSAGKKEILAPGPTNVAGAGTHNVFSAGRGHDLKLRHCLKVEHL